MRAHDTESFRNYFRMTPKQFDKILELVVPEIEKKNTRYRRCISAEERLAVTLRYLVSGGSMASLSYAFRLGRSTVSNIIPEVTKSLWNVLQPVYLPEPNHETWLHASKNFEKQWNFPHCVGAIDGKHILMLIVKGQKMC